MLTIDYCGYHVHNADRDRIYRPSGTASCLFLLILSPMTFYFPKRQEEHVTPGACILYPAGAYHHYQAEKEFFNSYVHFFCEDSQLGKYQIRTNEIFYPRQTDEIHELIRKIQQETIHQLEMAADLNDLLLCQLLILLRRAQKQSELLEENGRSYYPELFKLRETILNQCEYPWTVDEMCQSVNLGKSQFYHYYDRYFQQSPKEELLRARLQKARYYISNEAMTIKQAADASGFENICHFNRYFKKHMGCTPTQFKLGRV